ncbi:MAG: GNAT family N-acetyltransferase [Zetaproteobacteria bacterium]|nr:GNAT family N-acetyltransferase [Zetaproteobacteria bacterium]
MVSPESQPPYAEQQVRKASRAKFYTSEQFKVFEQGQWIGFLVDVSHAGYGLALFDSKQVGSKLEVEIRHGKSTHLQVKMLIMSCQPKSAHDSRCRYRVGAIPLLPDEKRSREIPRDAPRIALHGDFPCTGFFTNPTSFEDKVFITLLDLSARGFRARTSARNVLIGRGNKLEVTLCFPMQASFTFSTRVTFLRQQQDDLILGFELQSEVSTFVQMAGRYLSFAQGLSLYDLKTRKFKLTTLQDSFQFAYCRSRQEFLKIVALRAKAYGHDNERVSRKFEENMDRFDPYSRQVVCRNHGKIIACFRILFPSAKKSRAELYQAYGVNNVCDYIHSYMEVSKIAVNPKYRRSDLYLRMLDFCLKVALETDTRYIGALLVKERVKYYERMGFRIFSPAVEHSAHNVTLYPMVLDMEEFIRGEGVESIAFARFEPTLNAWRDAYGI